MHQVKENAATQPVCAQLQLLYALVLHRTKTAQHLSGSALAAVFGRVAPVLQLEVRARLALHPRGRLAPAHAAPPWARGR
jgi:hypothetical protein